MNRRELRLHIKALGEGRRLPEDLRFGLCLELARKRVEGHISHRATNTLMRQWSDAQKQRGSMDYPVPHPTYNSVKAYCALTNLWEPDKQKTPEDKEYVENRLRMCRYIAKELAQLEDWK